MSLAMNNVVCHFRLKVFGYGYFPSGEFPLLSFLMNYIFLLYLLVEVLYVVWTVFFVVCFLFYELQISSPVSNLLSFYFVNGGLFTYF